MTSRSDTFTRADAANLGGNWTGWSWSGSGSSTIVSNHASASGSFACGSWWSADSFGNDQSSEVTVSTLSGSSDWVGVTVRQASPGTGYLAIWFSGTFMLFDENGSTSPNLLGSASGTLTAGDTLKVSAVGTTITVYHNGAEVFHVTSSLYTAGKPGLAQYGTSSKISAWSATDAFGPTVTIDTTTMPREAQNVAVRRQLQASGATPPYTWSITVGSLPTGLSLSSSGELTGTPTTTGTFTFTVQATDSSGSPVSGTQSLSITVVSAAFSPGSPTTDGNGVTTYGITSVLNMNSAETIRTLVPNSPSPLYRRAIAICIPVNTGTDDTTFGNALDTIRILGLHNSLNLTVIEPSTGGNWMADSPSSVNLVQETYLLQLAAWARTNFGTGNEKLILVGFSRSGIAVMGIFLHWPGVFDGVVAWDFPGMMTAFDGSDPNGTVGGSPSSSYGTAENFTANYQLSAANLARWKAGTNLGVAYRIWMGGASFFNGDVPQFDAVLTTAGILHRYNFVAADIHNWHPSPDWLPTALTAVQKSLSSKDTGLLAASWPA